ncbi:MAG: hypothetical protein ABI898_08445 [Sphingomonadales bacterium]
MRVLLLATAVLSFSGWVPAQSASAQTSAPAAPAAVAAAPKFTIDTPIETIVADPAGKAALDSVMPHLTAHPMFDMFKSMSLKQLQPMSEGKITDEGLAKAGAALAAVK